MYYHVLELSRIYVMQRQNYHIAEGVPRSQVTLNGGVLSLPSLTLAIMVS